MQAFPVSTTTSRLLHFHLHTPSSSFSKPKSSLDNSSRQPDVAASREFSAAVSSHSRKVSKSWPVNHTPEVLRLQDCKWQKKVYTREASRKSVSVVSDVDDLPVDDKISTKKKSPRKSKKPSSRGRKKATTEAADIPENKLDSNSDEEANNLTSDEDDNLTSDEDNPSKKTTRKSRKKAVVLKKKVARSPKKALVDVVEVEESISEAEATTTQENPPLEETELLVEADDPEDISFTYEWPPLVCCYGAAQHAFLPSGRPANRLIDIEIHERMKDMFWSPTGFVRAPGGSASGVAVALASLGGRTAFMGKLGDDEYGQSMLYHLNVNKVQTRSVRIDSQKPTAMARMKITRRGGLRATSVKPCAEECLSSSEINIDVLNEAEMFYFNSSALLDANMKSTTMQAIQMSKKFGSVIFLDLNLPFPLWCSREETISSIQQAWNHADIIEVTKQELEFLLGIEPTERFDTKDNDKSKFLHYKHDIVTSSSLWHENLKVLFVTNGTSKIHYYTEKDDGWVHGMEDAPITPFTAEMSVAGDAIVSALMRMLTVQAHLVTDKSYLEHTIKYAIDCGVTAQWLASRIHGFPSSSCGRDGVKSISEREFRTVGGRGSSY